MFRLVLCGCVFVVCVGVCLLMVRRRISVTGKENMLSRNNDLRYNYDLKINQYCYCELHSTLRGIISTMKICFRHIRIYKIQ